MRERRSGTDRPNGLPPTDSPGGRLQSAEGTEREEGEIGRASRRSQLSSAHNGGDDGEGDGDSDGGKESGRRGGGGGGGADGARY